MNRIQPGQSIVTVPGDFLRVVQARPSGAAADWWDPTGAGLCVVAAYQPKGAANLAASYIDLSGNGNNCGPGVAPTWDAVNGWTGNGSTMYLVTPISCSVAYTAIVRYAGWSEATGMLLGHFVSGVDAFLLQRFTGSMYYTNGPNVVSAVPGASGVLAIAGKSGYYNGAFDKTVPAGANAGSLTAYILARHIGAGTQYHSSAKIQAVAFYNCTLTAPQVAAVAAAMALL